MCFIQSNLPDSLYSSNLSPLFLQRHNSKAAPPSHVSLFHADHLFSKDKWEEACEHLCLLKELWAGDALFKNPGALANGMEFTAISYAEKTSHV